MKAMKILLAVVAIAIIGFCVWKWQEEIVRPERLSANLRSSSEIIKDSIESLRNAPANAFYKKRYGEIKYYINNYHGNNNKNLRFSKEDNVNDQKRDDLLKELYFAYADKFIEFAMNVFNGSKWVSDDLNFIRDEAKILREEKTSSGSKYLEKSGIIVDSLRKIDGILNIHDEIKKLIFACKNLKYEDYDMKSNFPDTNGSKKIKDANKYFTNYSTYDYIRNYTDLKNDLGSIPETLYKKHKEYLKKKIEENASTYKNFNDQDDYKKNYENKIYLPLKKQIDFLEKNIYKINNKEIDTKEDRKSLKKALDDNFNAGDIYWGLDT
ncbi:MAG: hypothetical protein FWC26_10950 [Fibromonadales bacterium]|nr:hypothetical protein [Fibromonadales bacterium]